MNNQLPFPACFLIRIIIVRDGAGFFHPYVVVVVVVIITTDGATIKRKFERVVGDTRMGLMVVLWLQCATRNMSRNYPIIVDCDEKERNKNNTNVVVRRDIEL